MIVLVDAVDVIVLVCTPTFTNLISDNYWRVVGVTVRIGARRGTLGGSVLFHHFLIDSVVFFTNIRQPHCDQAVAVGDAESCQSQSTPSLNWCRYVIDKNSSDQKFIADSDEPTLSNQQSKQLVMSSDNLLTDLCAIW